MDKTRVDGQYQGYFPDHKHSELYLLNKHKYQDKYFTLIFWIFLS